MTEQQILERIAADPAVMTGKPVIRGSRLTVEYMLGLLARGMTAAEILEEYHDLALEDIQACLLFASRALVASRGNVNAGGRPTPSGEWALSHTWDGQPISAERPRGAMVVVYRWTAAGLEFLMQHRAHHGPAYAGDWAWSPPSGARQPGEPLEACAGREFAEETGLRLRLRPTAWRSEEWAVYVAEASAADTVRLDPEHDRFEWLVPAEALARCRPEVVAQPIRMLAADLERG